MAPAVGTEHR